MLYLFFPQPGKPPAREVADYSAEERTCLREAFAPVAATYRRHTRYGLYGAAGLIACILIMGILPKSWLVWDLVPALGFWLITFLMFMTRPRLTCPGCSNDLERSFGSYCLECGANSLRSKSWWRWPKCESCQKTMRWGRGRSFKVRACTHCGIMLDQKGV